MASTIGLIFVFLRRTPVILPEDKTARVPGVWPSVHSYVCPKFYGRNDGMVELLDSSRRGFGEDQTRNPCGLDRSYGVCRVRLRIYRVYEGTRWTSVDDRLPFFLLVIVFHVHRRSRSTETRESER